MRVLDSAKYEAKGAASKYVLTPLAVALRLGDYEQDPQMPYVYEHMMGLFDRINYASPNGDRLAEPDVDEGGKLDYALLEPLETIIGERWKYLHTPYYSVGYLLNPANIAVDINDAKHAPFIDELMADLELVCGRLFHGDAIKAAKAMDQYHLYKQPNSRFASPIRQAALQLPTYKPHTWWSSYAHDAPELAFVARRVLSKHVGIGAIERSHKKLKNSVFSKDRNALQHEKINRETYVSYNLQKLDRLRDDEPHWVEYYSTELSENQAAVWQAVSTSTPQKNT